MAVLPLSPTERSTPNRTKHRTLTDRAKLHEVLDAALICHVAMIRDGAPVVLPMNCVRDGESLLLHGSTGARGLREAGAGARVCVAVTHVDGVVYGRSLVNHSLNYRSAVVHGLAREITEPDEKLRALRAIAEHLAPGAWDYAVPLGPKDLAGVTVLAVDLREASVKARTGDPTGDAEPDVAAGRLWAGVLPLRQGFDEPVPSGDLPTGLPVPQHVSLREGVPS